MALATKKLCKFCFSNQTTVLTSVLLRDLTTAENRHPNYWQYQTNMFTQLRFIWKSHVSCIIKGHNH
jgi:hypothetical protein